MKKTISELRSVVYQVLLTSVLLDIINLKRRRKNLKRVKVIVDNVKYVCQNFSIGPGPIEVNKEFEIGKISEYADGSMNNWVHHVQYILPQVILYYLWHL